MVLQSEMGGAPAKVRRVGHAPSQPSLPLKKRFYTVLEEEIQEPVLKKARKDGVKKEKPFEWPLHQRSNEEDKQLDKKVATAMSNVKLVRNANMARKFNNVERQTPEKDQRQKNSDAGLKSRHKAKNKKKEALEIDEKMRTENESLRFDGRNGTGWRQ